MQIVFLFASIAYSAILTDINSCISDTAYGAGYKYCLKDDDSGGYCCDSTKETILECSS